MPSGITHDRITLWTLPWIAGIGYGITQNGELTLILSGGFLFSGLMFGPDLDIHSIQYKRWGAFKRIWLPYRNFFHHRSLFSHGPILGTLIRVLYLLSLVTFIAIITVGIAQLLWGFPWNWQNFALKQLSLLTNRHWPETLALFIGLELGAMSHSVSDLIGSNQKRRLRKKQQSKAIKVTKLGKISKVKR